MEKFDSSATEHKGDSKELVNYNSVTQLSQMQRTLLSVLNRLSKELNTRARKNLDFVTDV